jgi:hypothetical protein
MGKFALLKTFDRLVLASSDGFGRLTEEEDDVVAEDGAPEESPTAVSEAVSIVVTEPDGAEKELHGAEAFLNRHRRSWSNLSNGIMKRFSNSDADAGPSIDSSTV